MPEYRIALLKIVLVITGLLSMFLFSGALLYGYNHILFSSFNIKLTLSQVFMMVIMLRSLCMLPTVYENVKMWERFTELSKDEDKNVNTIFSTIINQVLYVVLAFNIFFIASIIRFFS